MAAAASLLMALATIASPPSTASPQEALAAPLAPPTYHIWPSARSSQDISGPIGIKMANGSLVWHVFVDCAGAGAGGRDLDWCHFSSFDLVSWTEHPVAIVSNSPFDAVCIDTGSVWQHPNGTVYATYATINSTSITASGSVDGDICLARAVDEMLVKWEKLCDQQPAGKIRSPICDWCRVDCPADCPAGMNSSAPSPFPGILGRGGHRDPPAPWLDSCAPGSSEQCWYQPVASGGRVPNGTDHAAAPVITMFKNNLALSRRWEAVPTQPALQMPALWWSSRVANPEYSCPDILALPGTDYVLFYSLLNRYFITKYANVSSGGPLLEAVRPFNHSFGLPFAFAGGAKKPERNWGLSGFSISKSGGVGPNNALDPQSRRLLFGTMPLPGSTTLPCRSNRHGCVHSGTIVTLPRDVKLLTAPDGTPLMGSTFAPELQQLRAEGGHTTLTDLAAGAALPAGRSLELLIEFNHPAGPAEESAASSFGVELIGGVRVEWDPAASVVRPSPCVGRGPGNGSSAMECLMPLSLHPGEAVRMHVYIDEGFVEISVQDQAMLMLSSESTANTSRLLGGVGAKRVDAWILEGPNQ